MGCDIHAWVQYKEPGSDMWWHWSGEMSWGRSYSLFDAMAGVRCWHGPKEWTPGWECPRNAVKPRGWPSEDRPYDAEDAGYHTPSWLTLDEFKAAVVTADATEWIDVAATIAAMEAMVRAGSEVRLVFAFDN